MRFAVAALMCLWIAPCAADLYRWVDPETGSVKFSSYPPPWFGDAAKQRRSPKVDVIVPGKPAPAFEPTPEAERAAAAAPVADAPRGDRRAELLKLLAQRVAALVASAPDATERALIELSEPLRELEQLDRQSTPSNPNDVAARLEQKYQLAVPLEAHRLALTQQLSGLPPPSPGGAPEAVANAWRGARMRIAALEWTNEALRAIDPRKMNERHFEMRALTQKVVAAWQPSLDAGRERGDRGR